MFSTNGSLFNLNNDLVGIDIGTSAVKVVKLKSSGSSYQVESYAIVPLAKGVVNNGAIEKMPELVSAIERAIKRTGLNTKNVAIAMPAAMTTTKVLGFARGLSDQAIFEQIESEANLHIPFAVEDARFDFCILQSPAGGAAGSGLEASNAKEKNKSAVAEDSGAEGAQVDVLIASARREMVDSRVTALEAAGLKPVVVDLESYCIQRALAQTALKLPKKGKGLVLAHLDIGLTSTQLTVCKDHEILFQRSQSFGGQQLTLDISKQFSLSAEEAEAKKRSNDLPPEYVQRVLKKFLQDASHLAERSLKFFYTSTPFGRVDHLYVGGGSAVVPGLIDSVLHATQVPTALFSPQAAYQINSKVNRRQLDIDAPGLSTAFGLAMRAFDR